MNLLWMLLMCANGLKSPPGEGRDPFYQSLTAAVQGNQRSCCLQFDERSGNMTFPQSPIHDKKTKKQKKNKKQNTKQDKRDGKV